MKIMEKNDFDSYGPSKDRALGKNKRGKLSTPEMEYIEKNVNIKTIKELSKDISKSITTIRKYVYSKNLVSKEDLTRNVKAKEEAQYRDILRHREYWAEVKQQFTANELKTFEEIWVKLWAQFSGDTLPSEELQMKKYITLEIMKDRFGKQIYSSIKELEKLQTDLDAERLKTKPDKGFIRELGLLIEKYQTNHILLSKNQREAMESQRQIESQLRVSRDDRIKSIADATKNWTTIIKLLNEDAEIRDEVGRHIEMTRAAKDNSQLLLSDYHKYVDGSLDRPILSKDTVGDVNEN
jgi:hypothetical protein